VPPRGSHEQILLEKKKKKNMDGRESPFKRKKRVGSIIVYLGGKGAKLLKKEEKILVALNLRKGTDAGSQKIC